MTLLADLEIKNSYECCDILNLKKLFELAKDNRKLSPLTKSSSVARNPLFVPKRLRRNISDSKTSPLKNKILNNSSLPNNDGKRTKNQTLKNANLMMFQSTTPPPPAEFLSKIPAKIPAEIPSEIPAEIPAKNSAELSPTPIRSHIANIAQPKTENVKVNHSSSSGENTLENKLKDFMYDIQTKLRIHEDNNLTTYSQNQEDLARINVLERQMFSHIGILQHKLEQLQHKLEQMQVETELVRQNQQNIATELFASILPNSSGFFVKTKESPTISIEKNTNKMSSNQSNFQKFVSELKLPFIVFISVTAICNPFVKKLVNRYCLRCTEANPIIQTVMIGLIVANMFYVINLLTARASHKIHPEKGKSDDHDDENQKKMMMMMKMSNNGPTALGNHPTLANPIPANPTFLANPNLANPNSSSSSSSSTTNNLNSYVNSESVGVPGVPCGVPGVRESFMSVGRVGDDPLSSSSFSSNYGQSFAPPSLAKTPPPPFSSSTSSSSSSYPGGML